MPSGQATRTGKISNGAHIDDAGAFYKQRDARFRDERIILTSARRMVPLSCQSSPATLYDSQILSCAILRGALPIGVKNGRFRLRFPRRIVSQPPKFTHDARHIPAI